MIHIYESHLGGMYYSFENFDYDCLYCETCGDSDTWVTSVSSLEDVELFIQQLLHEGMWTTVYIEEVEQDLIKMIKQGEM